MGRRRSAVLAVKCYIINIHSVWFMRWLCGRAPVTVRMAGLLSCVCRCLCTQYTCHHVHHPRSTSLIPSSLGVTRYYVLRLCTHFLFARLLCQFHCMSLVSGLTNVNAFPATLVCYFPVRNKKAKLFCGILSGPLTCLYPLMCRDLFSLSLLLTDT